LWWNKDYHKRWECNSQPSTDDLRVGGMYGPSTRVCHSLSPARRASEGQHALHKLWQTVIKLPRVTDKTCSRIQKTLLVVAFWAPASSELAYSNVVDARRNEGMNERSRWLRTVHTSQLPQTITRNASCRWQTRATLAKRCWFKYLKMWKKYRLSVPPIEVQIFLQICFSSCTETSNYQNFRRYANTEIVIKPI